MSYSKTLIQLIALFIAAFASAQSTSSSTTSAALARPSSAFVQQIGDTGGPAPVGVFQQGGVKTFTWDIGYVNGVTRFNTTRRMIGVNGKWPIEGMVVDYNDTVIFNVVNHLDKETAIHFHGIFHYGSQNMDGATYATQCPIPAGGSYQYKFQVLQWGTYWVHAHWKGEYVDGLRAPLVINPPKSVEMAPFDEETVISVADWYNEEHPIVLSRFLSIYNPSGAEPTPNQGMLNEVDHFDFKMTPGKTYKFRFVSFAALVTYDIYFEGHDMYVVEADGVDMEPSLQKAFALAPAQRMSVIVKAREAGNGTDVNYNVHAVMESGMFESRAEGLIEDVTMTLVYNSAPNAEIFQASNDTIPDLETDLMDETTLVPVAVLDALPNPHPSNSFNLEVIFQVFSDGVNHGTFNSTPFMMPAVPSLFTAQTIGSDHNLGDVAEIIIVNSDSGKHPFHLHGHAFQVIALSNETFDASNPYPNPLPANPMRRDTINIPGGGYTILRFQASNPGAWFLHCHIEWHFEAGLAAILFEAPSKIGGSIDPAMAAMCKAQGIPSSGNAAGNKGLDMTGYMVGPSTLPTTITATGWGAMAACAISSFVGVATVIWFAKKDEVVERSEAVPAN
ncbi:Cupredoxin [Obelidium mucronatum]|nr:Cupredoxin [Obelidium mucronatum]